MNDSSQPSLLILGCGYVGSRVAERFPHARTTRKNTFELNRRETWDKEVLTLPPGGIVLWTFPAASTIEEELRAVELYDTFFQGRKVFIYGTISSYRVKEEDQWITEETELDLDQIRTRTEERLRLRGACILHLAGIFGPSKDPVNWYQRGLIQAGLSFLNLIHLDDIVSITEKAFNSNGFTGERFNISNGRPKTHLEIVEILKKAGRLPTEFSIPSVRKAGSKRVNNTKIRERISLINEDFIDFP